MWDRDRDLHDTSTHWPVEKGWTETRSVENKSAITSAMMADAKIGRSENNGYDF